MGGIEGKRREASGKNRPALYLLLSSSLLFPPLLSLRLHSEDRAEDGRVGAE
jgi:hypothetical protein